MILAMALALVLASNPAAPAGQPAPTPSAGSSSEPAHPPTFPDAERGVKAGRACEEASGKADPLGQALADCLDRARAEELRAGSGSHDAFVAGLYGVAISDEQSDLDLVRGDPDLLKSVGPDALQRMADRIQDQLFDYMKARAAANLSEDDMAYAGVLLLE